jgi:hypothetical protein
VYFSNGRQHVAIPLRWNALPRTDSLCCRRSRAHYHTHACRPVTACGAHEQDSLPTLADLQRADAAAVMEPTSWEMAQMGQATHSLPRTGSQYEPPRHADGQPLELCQKCWDVPCACGGGARAAPMMMTAPAPRAYTQPMLAGRHNPQRQRQQRQQPVYAQEYVSAYAQGRPVAAVTTPAAPVRSRGAPVAVLCMRCMDTVCSCPAVPAQQGGRAALCPRCFDIPCAC